AGKNSAEEGAEAARWRGAWPGVGVLEQADRGRELRILGGRGQASELLRMSDTRRHFENLARQMIDPIQQTASAGNENSSAHIIDERFFFDCALEQFKNLAQP